MSDLAKVTDLVVVIGLKLKWTPEPTFLRTIHTVSAKDERAHCSLVTLFSLGKRLEICLSYEHFSFGNSQSG